MSMTPTGVEEALNGWIILTRLLIDSKRGEIGIACLDDLVRNIVIWSW